MAMIIEKKQFDDFVEGIEELRRDFKIKTSDYGELIFYDRKVLLVLDSDGFLLQDKFTPVLVTESLAILTARDLFEENENDSLEYYYFVVIRKTDGGIVGTWAIVQGFEILTLALKSQLLEFNNIDSYLGFFNTVFMKNEIGSNIKFLLQAFLDNSKKKASKAKVASAEQALIDLFYIERPEEE